MGDYTVIGEAGRTLVRLLWTAISADPDLNALITSETMITLESPAEHVDNNDTALLSVYLYRIGEDPYMKNRPQVEGLAGSLRQTPLALNLYYIITPMLTDAYDRHLVLGKTMQALHDRPILEGGDLTGTLASTADVLRLAVDSVPLQEIALVWQALSIPYMLCIPYVMRVAILQSTVETGGARVVSAQRGFGSRAPGAVEVASS